MKRFVLMISLAFFMLTAFAQTKLDSLKKKPDTTKKKSDTAKKDSLAGKPIALSELKAEKGTTPSFQKRNLSLKRTSKSSDGAQSRVALPPGDPGDPPGDPWPPIDPPDDPPLDPWPPTPTLSIDAGRTVSSLDVSNSGGGIFNVPIALPPGLGDIKPQISFSYNSQGSNGMMGLGWSISGLSAITRIGNNLHHDDRIDGINFNQYDRFALDGQRLILKSGTYGADGAEYQTEVYSNIRIFSRGTSSFGTSYGPDHFEVLYPDGSKAFYGGDAYSKTQSTYAITYSENALGARIKYFYLTSNNVLQISQIQYGSIGSASGINQVIFTYGVTGRAEQSYIGGTPFFSNEILSKVSIFGNMVALRTYKLTYAAMTDLNYQRISSIQEFDGSESKAFSPIYFSYGSTNNVVTVNTISNLSLSGIAANNSEIITSDFTGNGSMDFLLYPKNTKDKFYAFYDMEPGSPYLQIGYQVNTGPFKDIFPATWLTYNDKIIPGQGMLLVKNNNSNQYKFEMLSSGTVSPVYYQYDREWVGPMGPDYYSECDQQFKSGYPVHMEFLSGDFNGDGLTDMIGINDGTPILVGEQGLPPDDPMYYPGNCQQVWGNIDCSAYFFNMDRRLTNSNYVTNLGVLTQAFLYGDKLYATDMNGDGRTDILLVRINSMHVYTMEDNAIKLLWSTSDTRIRLDYPILLGDYNGDGKTDVMFSTGYNSYFATFMSTGKSFVKHEQYQQFSNVAPWWDPISPGYEALHQYYLVPNDIDGDGKTDIISSETITQNGVNGGVFNARAHYNMGASPYSFAPNFGSGYTMNSPLTNLRHNAIPIFLNSDRQNAKLEFGFISDQTVTLFKFQKDFKVEARLTNISQDGVNHSLEYTTLGDQQGYNPDLLPYGISYEQSYPYIDLHAIPGVSVVNKITRTYGTEQISQVFGYGKAVSHAGGLGFLGFGELTRSNWHMNSGDINRVFNISIFDPHLRGSQVRTFVSKSSYINPSIKDLSITSLPFAAVSDGASINDYISRSDQVFNTQTLPNKVFINIPTASASKDLLTNTFVNQLMEYDAYYNAVKTTTDNGGVGTKVIEASYDNNPGGYYIGRPLTTKTTLSNGSDIFITQEEYAYTGFLPTQIKKKGNGTAWITDNLNYDSFGNVTQKTTLVPGGGQRTISMAYDPTGRFIIQTTDIEGKNSGATYNAATGNKESATNAFGQTDNYVYDTWGRLITSMDYLSVNYHHSYVRDGYNIITTDSDDQGHMSISTNNPLGQAIESKEKNILGQYIGKAANFDAYGRQVAISQPAQPGSYTQWNNTLYDEYGRVKQLTDYTGKVTNISYSGLSVTASDGVKNVVTTKNALGQIISLQDGGGIVNYSYYANGNLKTADYAGITQAMEQDGWGRKTKLTDPSAGEYQYEYDGWGQLTKEINPKGTTEYTLDAAGKPTQKKITGDGTNMQYSYTYDGTTKLLNSMALTNADGNHASYNYYYDGNFRISSTVEDNLHARFTKSFLYDGFGRVSTEGYEAKDKQSNIIVSKTIEMQYQNGELLQTTLQGTGQVIWKLNTLDNRGQLSTSLQGTSLKTTTNYDAYGLPQQITVDKVNGSPTTLMNLGYNFDAQRGILNNRSNSALGWSENFSYDNLDRLTNYNDNLGMNSQSYDNRGRIQNNSQVGDYSYDSGSYRQTELNLSNNVTANNYYQNDYPLQQITYNVFKSPVEIIEQGKERVSFQYNASLERSHMYYGDDQADKMNRRYRRHYSEDNGMEITNDMQSGKTSFVFYLGGDAYTAPAIWKEVHEVSTTTQNLYFLQRDHLGSIVMITDDQGAVVEKRQFDAWGNIVQLTDGNNNPLLAFLIIDRGFTGHEHLSGVGLIHMNGRLYDPKLHRFLSPDNFVQDPYNTQNFNRYGYAMNNPLMFTDPSGEFLHFLIGGLIGGIVNWIANGAEFSWKGLGYFGVGAVSGALGTGIGSGVSSLIAGGSFGAGFVGSTLAKTAFSSFLSGTVIGASGGAAGGFSTGFGNALMDGKGFGSALGSGLKGGALGALGGGIVGGIAGGIDAVIGGRNFWTGEGTIYDTNISNIAGSGEEQFYSNKTASDFSFSHEELRKWSANVDNLYADGTAARTTFYDKASGYFKNSRGEKIMGTTDITGIWKKSTSVYLSKAAFASKEQLYMTMHHEYMHAYFLNKVATMTASAQHAIIDQWHHSQLLNWAPYTLKFSSYYFNRVTISNPSSFLRYGFKAITTRP